MARSLWQKLSWLPAVAVLLAVPASAALPAQTNEVPAESYTWDFTAEASNLLEQVRSSAFKLDRQAETLETFGRNNQISRESHGNQLNQIREQINTLGGHLARLQEIKHVTAPWQRMAIERVQPAAVQLAVRTEAAIQHLNENGTYLFAPAYQDHLVAIRDQSAVVKNHVDTALAYADAQQRLNQLQDKLELNAS